MGLPCLLSFPSYFRPMRAFVHHVKPMPVQETDGTWIPGETIVMVSHPDRVISHQLYWETPRCDSEEAARQAGIAQGHAWACDKYGIDPNASE